jgi:hypothetical protein
MRESLIVAASCGRRPVAGTLRVVPYVPPTGASTQHRFVQKAAKIAGSPWLFAARGTLRMYYADRHEWFACCGRNFAVR